MTRQMYAMIVGSVLELIESYCITLYKKIRASAKLHRRQSELRRKSATVIMSTAESRRSSLGSDTNSTSSFSVVVDEPRVSPLIPMTTVNMPVSLW